MTKGGDREGFVCVWTVFTTKKFMYGGDRGEAFKGFGKEGSSGVYLGINEEGGERT